MILAAFRPDTKARLVAENLLVPTVQMVFRRSLQNVTSRASYFSGDAHPAAFDGYDINLARMVSLANSIERRRDPAEVRIACSRRTSAARASTSSARASREQLFDTPGADRPDLALARPGAAAMLVSAEDTRDPNGRPLDLRVAPAAGRPGQGDDRAARRRPPRPHHPRLARPLPASPRTTR